MGRLKKLDTPVAKEISLPTSVVTAVDELVKDPFTGKPKYGAWGQLTEALLTKWMTGEVKVPGFEIPEISLDDLEV